MAEASVLVEVSDSLEEAGFSSLEAVDEDAGFSSLEEALLELAVLLWLDEPALTELLWLEEPEVELLCELLEAPDDAVLVEDAGFSLLEVLELVALLWLEELEAEELPWELLEELAVPFETAGFSSGVSSSLEEAVLPDELDVLDELELLLEDAALTSMSSLLLVTVQSL